MLNLSMESSIPSSMFKKVFYYFRISLEVMTLNPVCESVETSEGVPVTVTGVAQVKIMRDQSFLEKACEQFLGKSVREVERVILQTLEGHLRAILGKEDRKKIQFQKK